MLYIEHMEMMNSLQMDLPVCSFDILLTLAIIYNENNAKQPDQSYTPTRFPAPTRQNKLQLQANGDYFPSLVFEIAVSNEDRARLLDDACKKYFTNKTSVNIWVGIKVDRSVLGAEHLWVRWGRRKLLGTGLKLEQQTEDEHGQSTSLPVHLPPGVTNLMGQIEIPSTLIFQLNQVPAAAPPRFVITFETIRGWITRGLC
jgi:hypothetical protein